METGCIYFGKHTVNGYGRDSCQYLGFYLFGDMDGWIGSSRSEVGSESACWTLSYIHIYIYIYIHIYIYVCIYIIIIIIMIMLIIKQARDPKSGPSLHASYRCL